MQGLPRGCSSSSSALPLGREQPGAPRTAGSLTPTSSAGSSFPEPRGSQWGSALGPPGPFPLAAGRGKKGRAAQLEPRCTAGGWGGAHPAGLDGVGCDGMGWGGVWGGCLPCMLQPRGRGAGLPSPSPLPPPRAGAAPAPDGSPRTAPRCPRRAAPARPQLPLPAAGARSGAPPAGRRGAAHCRAASQAGRAGPAPASPVGHSARQGERAGRRAAQVPRALKASCLPGPALAVTGRLLGGKGRRVGLQ